MDNYMGFGRKEKKYKNNFKKEVLDKKSILKLYFSEIC